MLHACKLSGATPQIECPPGTYCRVHALECTSCPLGWSQPDYRSTAIVKCSRDHGSWKGHVSAFGKIARQSNIWKMLPRTFRLWNAELARKVRCVMASEAPWTS